MRHQRSALLAVILAGCGGEPGTIAEIAEIAEVFAPLYQASDRPDRDCKVILRSAHRLPGTGGYETECIPGGSCWFVWGVWVDVAEVEVAAGSVPSVLYQSGSNSQWHAVQAVSSEAQPGYVRFFFRVFEHTVGPGMSMTSLMRTRIQMIPALTQSNGSRLFDHNRHPGSFDNYLLVEDNQWSVSEDLSTCPLTVVQPPQATLQFLSGWSEAQHGAIVSGGRLSVEYDPVRLTQCRTSYTFAPAWHLDASVRFFPGGQVFEGPVVQASTDDQGRRVEPVLPIPFEVDVPADATSVEIWFRNWSTYGGLCEGWDSNLGRNYRFEVVQQGPGPVVWAGNWGRVMTRACELESGLPEPVTVDSYLIQRSCMQVHAEVYTPDVTHSRNPERPHLLQAQLLLSVDGGPVETAWLDYEGRTGNNNRYSWTLPRERMTREEWQRYDFAFRFSTDGLNWFRIAQGDGPDGGAARSILRNFPVSGWSN